MPDPRKRIVEEGYDRLDQTYRDWVHGFAGGFRTSFLREVLAWIPVGGTVLELGCGPGTDAKALAEGRTYVGVDLSAVQLAHARVQAPHGRFLQGDFMEMDFDAETFDAIVSLYVFNHLPQTELPGALSRAWTWLRPHGLFAASLGSSDNPGEVEEMWLGRVDMFFAGMSREENERHLREARFRLEVSEEVTELAEGEDETFHWVIATKPPSD